MNLGFTTYPNVNLPRQLSDALICPKPRSRAVSLRNARTTASPPPITTLHSTAIRNAASKPRACAAEATSARAGPPQSALKPRQGQAASQIAEDADALWTKALFPGRSATRRALTWRTTDDGRPVRAGLVTAFRPSRGGACGLAIMFPCAAPHSCDGHCLARDGFTLPSGQQVGVIKGVHQQPL